MKRLNLIRGGVVNVCRENDNTTDMLADGTALF